MLYKPYSNMSCFIVITARDGTKEEGWTSRLLAGTAAEVDGQKASGAHRSGIPIGQNSLKLANKTIGHSYRI